MIVYTGSEESSDSSVGKATGCKLGGSDSIPSRGNFSVCIATRPPVQQTIAYSLRGKIGRGVKLIAHILLIPR
jgi:hypothetical protein